jgi:hypothetical protein
MKISAKTAVICYLLAASLVFGVYCWLTWPDAHEGVNIATEQNDPELVGLGRVDVVQFGIYYSPERNGEQAPFIVQYRTDYPNHFAHVVKTIFKNEPPFTTRSGHYMLYQYFREADGTLEHDTLVNPEVEMGASVWHKYRQRYFDSSLHQTSERYIRLDGTLACNMDTLTKANTSYFADGKTVRELQTNNPPGNTVETRYRKDGRVWWQTDYTTGKTHVYFDLDGAPIDAVITTDSASKNGVFEMGGNDAPKLEGYDNYWRKDGTLAYRQTWYGLYDKSAKQPGTQFKDAIGSVTVYDASGKKPLATYDLEIRPEGQPRLITQVTIHNADGTTLIRKYNSPNHRASEETLSGGAVISIKTFPVNDWFQEAVPDIFFHGFGNRDIWGNVDVNPHDI